MTATATTPKSVATAFWACRFTKWPYITPDYRVVWHELKIACKDANNSSVLKPLLTPISLVVSAFTALEQKLKGGSFSTSDLTGAGNAINGLQQKSTSLGYPIKQLFGG